MSCSKPIQALSFAEIIQGRDASVRVTHDGMIYAVDLVVVMTGLSRDDAGKTLRRLSDKHFSSDKLSERNIGGSGCSKTKLVSFKDALELIMVLPGNVAKETRVQFKEIITRYMAGDKSLHAEVDANAASDSPIAQMARASMAAPSEDEAFMVGLKRRREELELFKIEEETKGLKQARILAACAELERINDPSRTKLDTRTRLMIQDAMQSSILCSIVAVPTQTQQQAPSPNTPLTISGVADELGYKLIPEDVKRIGVAAKKRYDELHKDDGETLSKHLQMCGGRPTYVNSYSEKDRDLLVEVIRADQESARNQQKKASKPLNSYFNKK